MFDSQKIDSYFDGNNAYNAHSERTSVRGVAWRRLIKLTLPCLAAILLGLLVVMPNIKKSVDLNNNITMPRKNEMEQLHIEETVFNVTDNKNRVNKIVADSVDETEAGSQIYKIINPKGAIPTDTGKTDISADIGFFNQQNNVLDLEKNVKAVVNEDTLITTEAATYDFDNDKGWGNVAVKAEGDWGTMNADSFAYDAAKEILTLKGKHRITTERGILTAEKETLVYRNENKTVSLGNAVITQKDKKLYADKIVAFFGESSKKELERAEAYGNVRIISPKETITGDKGKYDARKGEIEMFSGTGAGKKFVTVLQGENELQAKHLKLYLDSGNANELKEVIAYDAVTVQTPKEIIFGNEGYYMPKAGKIEIYGTAKNAKAQKDMVVIRQGENTLFARKAEAFLDKNNQIKYAVAEGNVEIDTPKGSAWGDKGIYNPVENKVELFDNVRLEQDGNFIFGAHAETDLETSVSRISGDETTGGRIRGTFYKKKERR